MKGMGDMMRQAQLMHNKMSKLQEELKEKEVEAGSGGGMVTAKATCAGELRSIQIDPAVVDPDDVDMLQDLVLAAVNEVLKKGRETSEEEMKAITGGIQIPGMF